MQLLATRGPGACDSEDRLLPVNLFLKHSHHQPNEIVMSVCRTSTKAEDLFIINLIL